MIANECYYIVLCFIIHTTPNRNHGYMKQEAYFGYIDVFNELILMDP